MFNPYYPQQNQQQVQQGIAWVGSDEEAVRWMVLPNSSVTLRSTDGKTVYFKTADASGRPNIEVYTLMPRQAAPEEKTDYVTRREFEELISRLKGKGEAE